MNFPTAGFANILMVFLLAPTQYLAAISLFLGRNNYKDSISKKKQRKGAHFVKNCYKRTESVTWLLDGLGWSR
jgi:hypothetical protein